MFASEKSRRVSFNCSGTYWSAGVDWDLKKALDPPVPNPFLPLALCLETSIPLTLGLSQHPQEVGITGTAHDFFHSYLTSRQE